MLVLLQVVYNFIFGKIYATIVFKTAGIQINEKLQSVLAKSKQILNGHIKRVEKLV